MLYFLLFSFRPIFTSRSNVEDQWNTAILFIKLYYLLLVEYYILNAIIFRYHPARAYLDPAYYPPIRTYTDALGRSYQVHYLPNGQIYRIPLATRDLPPAVIASLLGWKCAHSIWLGINRLSTSINNK